MLIPKKCQQKKLKKSDFV
ncbi:MAG: hypothetical protein J1E34_08405 [Oscillospiraceae bacterium]|nr:hypothetical protein [Oscillospiraceae bacterium]